VVLYIVFYVYKVLFSLMYCIIFFFPEGSWIGVRGWHICRINTVIWICQQKTKVKH